MFFHDLDLNCEIELCDSARHYFAGAGDEFWRAVTCEAERALAVDDVWRYVPRCRGEFKVKGFGRLDRFPCMAFAQARFRESVRDIHARVRAHGESSIASFAAW